MINTTKNIGDTGEQIAFDYLIGKGFECVAKNYRCKYGEIDLLCWKTNRLYIFEVKYRNSNRFGWGENGITPLKIKKILSTFNFWLSKNAYYQKYPCEIYALILDGKKQINVFKIK